MSLPTSDVGKRALLGLKVRWRLAEKVREDIRAGRIKEGGFDQL